MTSLSLDAGDWEVVDCSGNPVPGDPDAVTVLVHQFLNQAGQAQERGAQLASVHSSNAGKMQGDYAASFESILERLPSDSNALAETYQSCGEALNVFATELDSIQSQAAEALQQGTEADAVYRSALNDFSSYVSVPVEPGGTWRGLNQESAQELATPLAEQYAAEAEAESENPAAYQEEYDNVMSWAAEVGEYAGAAEDDRQEAVAAIKDLVTQYQDSTSRCSQALKNAVDSVPPAQLAS
jgi:uncharacterized protein YukE